MRQADLDLMISLLRPKSGTDFHGKMEAPEPVPAVAVQQQRYKSLSSHGDEIAAAIIRLTPSDWSESVMELEAGLAKYGAGVEAGSEAVSINQPAAVLLNQLAVDALEEGRIPYAALLLALRLAVSKTDLERADALCSISYCAVCLNEFAIALLLAKASTQLHPVHPRAHCIIGLCQLQQGDRKAAQGALAVAARIARTNRDYVELLQAAQRLLLIRHFED